MPAGDLRKRRRLRRVLTIWVASVVATAWLIPTNVEASYRDSYGRALEAYKSGHLDEAKRLFTEALSDNAQPVARVRLYGVVFVPYVPQHYLGLIAMQRGDCATALAQWSSAGTPAVIAELGDLAIEEKNAGAKCGALAQAKPLPPTPVTPPPDKSVASTNRPDKSGSVPAESAPPNAQSKPLPPQSNTTATTRPVDVPVSKPTVSVPNEKYAPAEKAPPPDQLVQIFDKFLQGKLSEVARINPDTFADSRARFHAYLIRGGALYTMSQLSGDAQLEDRARADVKSAHGIYADAVPDDMLFSPRFRAFYAQNR